MKTKNCPKCKKPMIESGFRKAGHKQKYECRNKECEK